MFSTELSVHSENYLMFSRSRVIILTLSILTFPFCLFVQYPDLCTQTHKYFSQQTETQLVMSSEDTIFTHPISTHRLYESSHLAFETLQSTLALSYSVMT